MLGSPAESTVTVNPARAGMIPSWAMIAEDNNGKPRASGDDPRPAVSRAETLT